MHEISLVRNIFNTLEDEFSKEDLDRLTGIDLKVGLLANVEPTLMQNAFEAVTETENKFLKAKLSINVVPILVECPLCGDVAEVKNYLFQCGNGHPTNNVIQGEELLIERVHFQED
tara:strand:- start:907 stop:1254 length:348 start_codon:yes stop_codon:yes gene_type:complete